VSVPGQRDAAERQDVGLVVDDQNLQDPLLRFSLLASRFSLLATGYWLLIPPLPSL
jgi:hypothetical protein